MKEGDKVLRKNGQGKIGTIERICAGKAYVRWENALRPFSGGYSDNHSMIALSALKPATDDNVQVFRLRRAKKNLKILEERSTARFCKGCHYRMVDRFCWKCQRELTDQDVEPCAATMRDIERTKALIAELEVKP